MNTYNALHGDKPDESPRDWKSQPPTVHLKPCTPTYKTTSMVLGLIGRLNNYAADNGDV